MFKQVDGPSEALIIYKLNLVFEAKADSKSLSPCNIVPQADSSNNLLSYVVSSGGTS